VPPSAAPAPPASAPRPEAPPLQPDTLARFVDPLPTPPVLAPMGTRPDPRDGKRQLPFHRVLMTEAAVTIHRDLPPTRVWTYGASFPGPTLELKRDEPVQVEWINALPPHPFWPGQPQDDSSARAIVHLHGGRVPPDADGAPDAAIPPGRSLTVVYPNAQDAATLWYRDDARGAARANLYAGLLGLALVRDAHESSLGLPSGPQEVPLVLCDRVLGQDGQLRPAGAGAAEAHLVNGRLFPFLAVEPRRYRLRIVNASTAHVYDLAFAGGVPTVHQIGGDQGLLAAPLPVSTTPLAPGERADLIVDFARLAGRTVLLRSGSIEFMQFRVSPGAGPRERPLPAQLGTLPKPDPARAAVKRTLVLDGKPRPPGVTERPRLGTTELWSLVNATPDMHPLHLHLVRFRVLDRQRFDPAAFAAGGKLQPVGPLAPGDAAEAGWKDTVRAEPGMVTRILVPFEGYAGQYAWQCQHLEQAAAGMAGRFQVVGPPT